MAIRYTDEAPDQEADATPQVSTLKGKIRYLDESAPQAPVATPQSFREQYIAKAQRGIPERIGDALGMVPAAIGGLYNVGREGIQGIANITGDTAGDLLAADQLPFGESIAAKLGALGTGTGRFIQSGAEGVARSGFDVGEMIRSQLSNPVVAASLVPGIGTALLPYLLQSRTPGEPEIALAEESNRMAQLNAAAREGGLVPSLTGQQAEPGVSDALAMALGMVGPGGAATGEMAAANALRTESRLAGAARAAEAAAGTVPIIEKLGTTGIARGAGKVGEIIGQGFGAVGRGIKEAVTTKSITDDALTALNPRARSINPRQQVEARIKAEKAWDTIAPELSSVYEGGGSLETSVSTADAMVGIKNKAFALRESLASQPISINLDPIADAYLDLSKNPNIALKYPEAVSQLEAEAAKYRGKIVPAQQAEQLNRLFNADTEAKLAGMTAKDRVAKIASTPTLNGDKAASGVLKSELMKALGGEFSEAGKIYGAASEIEQHALNQAVRQRRLEDVPDLVERMSAASADTPWGAVFSAVKSRAIKMASSPDAFFARLDKRVRSAVERGDLSKKAAKP